MDYLILGLPAEFFFEMDKEDIESASARSGPQMKVWPHYLSSYRKFSNFCLKPVILERPDDKYNSYSISYLSISKNDPELEVVGLSYQNSRYALIPNSGGINRYRVQDALNASMAILLDSTDPGNIGIVEIVEADINDDRLLANMDLRKYVTKQANLSESAYIDNSIWYGQSFGLESNIRVFEIADLIIDDEVILYASMFYREAILCVNEEIGHPQDYLNSVDEKPLTISEAVKLEGALHGFYKVLEAIYGGMMASTEPKILKKFGDNGIDLNQVVQNSYAGKEESAIEKVIKLGKLRNERAAHGRVFSDRTSTYAELYDNQLLASSIIRWAIDARYGFDIYKRWNPCSLVFKRD